MIQTYFGWILFVSVALSLVSVAAGFACVSFHHLMCFVLQSRYSDQLLASRFCVSTFAEGAAITSIHLLDCSVYLFIDLSIYLFIYFAQFCLKTF